MTPGEQKLLKRGVVAGALVGLAIGGMIALVIVMKADFLSTLVH